MKVFDLLFVLLFLCMLVIGCIPEARIIQLERRVTAIENKLVTPADPNMGPADNDNNNKPDRRRRRSILTDEDNINDN